MNGWQMVRLVAMREIVVRLRSKVFVLSTVGVMALIVIAGVVINVASGSEPTRVGFTPDTRPLADSVVALAGSSEGAEESITEESIDDRAAGEAQIRDGDLDVLVAGTPTDLTVVVNRDLDPGLEAVFTALAQQQALTSRISDLGGDPDAVAAEVANAAPEVVELDPAETDGAKIVASYIVGILIFMGLMTTGQLVAQGVVEEKTSRVVELLLAAVRPWHLMAGKVLGIGVVGLVQVLATVVAGVGTAAVLGLVDTSTLDLGSTAIWTLVWFLVGYLAYSLVLAGLAALVSRQEEVGSVISPVMTLLVVPYVIAVSVGTWEPDNPLVATLSYIPFCAPMVMPVRVAGGAVATWEVLLAVAISVAVIPLLVWAAGRMYSRAVLQTGARVKIMRALRG